MTKSSPSAAEGGRRVIIGRVGRPHGVSGEVSVAPMTDFPERFHKLAGVYVGDERRTVARARCHGDRVLLTFDGCDSREAAAALGGQYLSVDRDEAMPLRDGEFYLFDLIGLDVVDEQGHALGTVADVLQPGANDVYVIRPTGGGDEILLAAVDEFVRDIDLAAHRMVVRLPEVVTC